MYPECGSDAGIYERAGLLGEGPSIFAHVIFPTAEDLRIMKKYGSFAVHCPDATTNIIAGIAPVAAEQAEGIRVALGSDVGAGHSLAVYRQAARAVQLSKLKEFYEPMESGTISFANAFYMATKEGGSLFGKTGSFEKGYDFDALVITGQERCGRTAGAVLLHRRRPGHRGAVYAREEDVRLSTCGAPRITRRNQRAARWGGIAIDLRRWISAGDEGRVCAGSAERRGGMAEEERKTAVAAETEQFVEEKATPTKTTEQAEAETVNTAEQKEPAQEENVSSVNTEHENLEHGETAPAGTAETQEPEADTSGKPEQVTDAAPEADSSAKPEQGEAEPKHSFAQRRAEKKEKKEQKKREKQQAERERIREIRAKERAKEQARAEKEQAKREKEQAKAAKEQARREKEQARADKEQAKQEKRESRKARSEISPEERLQRKANRARTIALVLAALTAASLLFAEYTLTRYRAAIDSLNQANQELATARAAADDLDGKIKELQDENASLTQELGEAKDELSTAKQELSDTQEQLKEANDKNQTYQSTLDVVTQNIEKIKKAVSGVSEKEGTDAAGKGNSTSH